MANMKICSALLIVALCQAAVKSSDWEEFKIAHGKSYSHFEEELYRKSLFEKNVEEIREHNRLYMSGLKTYSKAVNKFSDMLLSEVVGEGFRYEDFPESDLLPELEGQEQESPFFDWREKGAVSRVKIQGKCGSCWAFSATGALEGQMKVKLNKTVVLSEQQLVDCDKKDNACRGGYPSNAYDYIKGAHGINSETDYPYVAKEQSECHYNPQKAAATCSGYKQLPPADELSLVKYAHLEGPISVGVQATDNLVQYNGGLFIDHSCKEELNHGVLVVGFGKEKQFNYYIVKNSWGTYWGENGYVKWAAYYDNMCGISNVATFPKVP